jgi:predicted dehydrogenase
LAVEKRIRYAVVGLGYIAQAAVLPAFVHARSNSQLVALVSDDDVKLKRLSKKYGVSHTYSYASYEECLQSGEVDAVYIALPNTLHREYTEKAAEAGIHVLCEKPMATSEDDCVAMISACDANRVKLMIAYRLHFEEANLSTIELLESGKLGEPRIFNSTFTQQVKEGDIRLRKETGGGTLYDIGVYCINAARYLFRDEPEQVVAVSVKGKETRFREVEESVSAVLRFSGDRLASFSCSFGASDMSAYEVVGTKGSVRLDPGYELAAELKQTVKIGEKSKTKVFPKRDQFAPELIYFSDCILQNKEPEPSGREGLIDVKIIEALYRSARTAAPVTLEINPPKKRPTRSQQITKPGVPMPKLVNASSPSPD